MEWKKMETAPQSGEVLIYDPEWGVCEGMRFDDGHWGLATFNGSIKKANPIRWMHKPAPPISELH